GVVRAGEAVVANPASGNRDETVFDNPDEIDLARKHNPHIAFGYGVHHCLGAPVARLELQVVLGTLVRRLPGLRLAVPADEVQWPTERLVRGATGLSVPWWDTAADEAGAAPTRRGGARLGFSASYAPGIAEEVVWIVVVLHLDQARVVLSVVGAAPRAGCRARPPRTCTATRSSSSPSVCRW